ncbi:MAG TPA: tetratricopeptide repeat protein [Drouetiella sp.]
MRNLVFQIEKIALAQIATMMTCSLASYAVQEPDKELAKARTLYQNAQTAEAIALCTKKLAAGQDLPKWHEMLAQADALTSPNSDRARQEIKKALQLAPGDEHIVASAGLILADSSADANAIFPKLQAAIKAHPKNGRLHAALSAHYEVSHDPAAEQEILTAINLDPLDFDVNNQAVRHYSNAQKPDEIEKAYSRLIKGSPKSAFAYVSRGSYRKSSYHFSESAQDFHQAVTLNPKYDYAYSMLAKSLKRGTQLPEAIKIYDAMIAKEPTSANLYGRRASCYAGNNQPEKAIKDFNQALNMIGKSSKFVPQTAPDVMLKDTRLDYNKYWLERVECREKLGQIDQAIAELTVYVVGVKYPDSAYEIRQRLYRKKGLYDKALADLNYLIKKDAFVAERYSDRADVLKKLGRTAEANQDLKHAENIEATGSP